MSRPCFGVARDCEWPGQLRLSRQLVLLNSVLLLRESFCVFDHCFAPNENLRSSEQTVANASFSRGRNHECANALVSYSRLVSKIRLIHFTFTLDLEFDSLEADLFLINFLGSRIGI